MDPHKTEELEKLRRQFNQAPYPRTPLDASPAGNPEALYLYNLVTSYYLRHRKVVEPNHKLILDAGCGTGYKSLILANANPGARIIGIDLSEESIRLADERLKYHNVANVEFYAISLEDLSQLGLTFDFINCDEVLYLLPDPLAGLQALRTVLKPEGIIRANLHHAFQRASYFRAQAIFGLMGLMEDESQELAEKTVMETMNALKDETRLKIETWGPGFRGEPPDSHRLKEGIHANHLLAGDKGFLIADMFELLAAADLEFVSMVGWRHWDVADLFEDPDNLPAIWAMSLAGASLQEKLQVYELMNPVHRLIDFWCAHPGEAGIPVDEWTDQDWQTAIVHLHPQLRTDALKAELIQCVNQSQALEISKIISLPTQAPVFVESHLAACLLPLWEGAQPIEVLIDRYHQIRSVDPVTLEAVTQAAAFAAVKDLLNRLDAFLYVLTEQP